MFSMVIGERKLFIKKEAILMRKRMGQYKESMGSSLEI